MSRVVQDFVITSGDAPGRSFDARVRAEQDESGLWHAWIEFVPTDGGAPRRTGRETTQSSLEQLEYWASGLTASYLEMALERATRSAAAAPKRAGSPPRTFLPDSPTTQLEIEAVDSTLPRRLMGGAELSPGATRRIAGGGLMIYEGALTLQGLPTRYAFLLQYNSVNAAALIANTLWSELHDQGVRLFIEGVPVDLDHHQIGNRLAARLTLPRRRPA